MPFCPKCGKEIKEEDTFCPNCGQTLKPAVVQGQVAQIRETAGRPAGITVLAVLEILCGLAFLGLGGLLAFAASILGALGVPSQYAGMIPGFISGLLGVIGGILIIFALISFVIAWGYWTGQGWAWAVGLVFAILGAILGLITLPGGIISVILNGLIIYYLTRPYVKRFFGKEPVSVTI